MMLSLLSLMTRGLRVPYMWILLYLIALDSFFNFIDDPTINHRDARPCLNTR